MSVTRSSPVVTKWVTITSALMGQSPVETVPECPVQIRAYHHIDVHTDINQVIQVFLSTGPSAIILVKIKKKKWQNSLDLN